MSRQLESYSPAVLAEWIRRRQEFAARMNSEQVAQAMEGLPTDVLEWGVRFEALSHVRHVRRAGQRLPGEDL